MHSKRATDANPKQGNYSGVGTGAFCNPIPCRGVISLAFIRWSIALCLPPCLTLLLPKATPDRSNTVLVLLTAWTLPLSLWTLSTRTVMIWKDTFRRPIAWSPQTSNLGTLFLPWKTTDILTSNYPFYRQKNTNSSSSSLNHTNNCSYLRAWKVSV